MSNINPFNKKQTISVNSLPNTYNFTLVGKIHQFTSLIWFIDNDNIINIHNSSLPSTYNGEYLNNLKFGISPHDKNIVNKLNDNNNYTLNDLFIKIISYIIFDVYDTSYFNNLNDIDKGINNLKISINNYLNKYGEIDIIKQNVINYLSYNKNQLNTYSLPYDNKIEIKLNLQINNLIKTTEKFENIDLDIKIILNYDPLIVLNLDLIKNINKNQLNWIILNLNNQDVVFDITTNNTNKDYFINNPFLDSNNYYKKNCYKILYDFKKNYYFKSLNGQLYQIYRVGVLNK